jgi:hypothetical protein
MAAIEVYLDSSDFSKLSDPHSPDASLSRVRDELFELRDAGLCQFRFSLVHVCEMAPKDAAAMEASVRRLGLAQDLCSSKCLRATDEIDRVELLAALRGHEFCRDFAFGERAQWLPDGELALEKHAAAFIQDAAAVRLSARQQGNRDIKQVNLAVRLLMIQQLEKYASKLPLNEAVRAGVLRLSVGSVSVTTLTQTLLMGFVDLREVARWAAATDAGRQFVAVLREKLRYPVADIETLRALIQELVEASDTPKVGRQKGASSLATGSRDAVSQYRSAEIEKIFEANREWLAANEGVPSELPLDLDTLSMPRLDNHTAIFVAHFRMNATGNRDLSVAASDLPDILHANYLPYVDVFRADAVASQAFAKQARDLGVDIVSRLEDLPAAIRRRRDAMR